MHTHEALPRRRRASPSRWAAVAVAATLTAGPIVLVASPAFAAEVTSPAEGSTVDTTLPFFDGTGVAGNTVTITYPGADGSVALAGADDVAADGTFGIITEFSSLSPGQTTVVTTIVETDPAAAPVGAPVIRSFSFATAPVPEFPFAITSPATGETVTTTTPTFQGTGRVGDTIEITYTNARLETSVAGRGVVGADGTFSIPTSFLDLPPGAVEVRTISTPTGPGGEQSSATLATNLIFTEAPVPAFVPNDPAISVVPDQITVSDSKRTDRGLEITATGYGQGEELEVTLSGPGGAVELTVPDTGIFADDTGSYADSLVLIGDVPLGVYTLTITGVTGGLTQSDTFTVIADPVPAGNTPGAGRPGAGNDGELAATGPNALGGGLLALAVLMTLAGTALVLRRREVEAVAS